MTEPTKIDFHHRRTSSIDDVTDLVTMLLPGNRNQQHAAGRILLALRCASAPLRSLGEIESRHGISRRTLQRTRAKLSRLGLIEYIGWMNSRYGGQEGWKLSGRMSTALRRLADRIDRWRRDSSRVSAEKEELLVGLLSDGAPTRMLPEVLRVKA